MGYRVSGVEMSKASVDYVRSRLGLDVEADDFLNVPENERYDVMTLWDVLEHTDDADRIVEKVSRMLRPEGFVFIQVPRVDSIIALLLKHRWWALGLDHVNYFSAKTIRLLLEKCGFEVIEIKSSIELKNVLLYVLLPKFRKKRGRPALTAADRQREFNKITSKRMWLRKALVAVHNAVYRSLGFLRIGDEMIVVAQKR
jgi:SAM-dependent methyltransferase